MIVLLEIKDMNAGYGFLNILWDMSLNIDEGEFVALIGPNGAGKSTTLKTIAGALTPSKGAVKFRGEDIAGRECHQNCREGISYISEELNLFTGMTVFENLEMGSYSQKDKSRRAKRLEFVYELFPRLEERTSQFAGTLSGGERKMLAIARGMMSEPALMLVDEPSLGLAPQVTNEVFESLRVLNSMGVTILLVEQNVTKTLQFTKRAYVVEKGRIVLEGQSADLISDEHVRKIYLGA
jgi:branched-chain amino acid transport system ATP-binding protein